VKAARELGVVLAQYGIGAVYGGGRVGLMGEVADTVMASGGRVIGVIPEALATKEVAHDGLTELVVVPGMHERKALMAARSDAFLVLPGGIGTLEEFFEILTWAALGLHNKPIGLLNVEGYYEPLLGMLAHAVTEGFLRSSHIALVRVSCDPESLVRELLSFVPPPRGPQWIGIDET
jgi:uncharacterized protein (TIGR00730 family)